MVHKLYRGLQFYGDVNPYASYQLCMCVFVRFESGLNVVAIAVIKLCLARLYIKVVCLALSFGKTIMPWWSGYYI